MKNGKTLLKVLLVVGLFYFLAKKGLISLETTGRALRQWQLVLPAYALLMSSGVLGAIRWQWLLRPQGIHLPMSRTLQLTFIGNFFNIALPGAVSGDFVKAFYVAKEAQGLRARAFGSILFDRVAGLSALILLSASALLLGWGSLRGTPLFSAIQFMILVGAAGFLSFYAYLFLVREKHDPVLKILQSAEKKFPKMGSLNRIYEALRHYHTHKITVLKVVLISVLIHIMVCTSCVLFAAAMGIPEISKLAVFVVVPLGLLVTAVPIMPAGIGTGHAAFSWLFHFLGTEHGADLFSMFALAQLFTGVIGGLVYLRFRAHEPSPQA